MHLTDLEFASLLSYAPHGNLPIHERTKQVRTFLKNDTFVASPDDPTLLVPMSEWIALTLEGRKNTLPFVDFFRANTVLVPTPKSSLTKPDTLWVPERIANELVKRGFGAKVTPYLKRIKALPKSAY